MAGAIDLILNFRANNSDAVRGIQDMIRRENDLRNTLQQNIQTRQANNAVIQNDIRVLQNQRSALQGNTSVILQQRDAIDAQIRALRNHINVNNDGINVYRQQLQAVNQNTAALNQQRQALIQNDRAAEEAAQTNKKLATTFGAIAAAIGAAGLAFAKLALDASTKFSEAMGNVASVTLDSKKAIGEMSEEIKRFVNMNLSATATEAAQAMYEIRSAGISAKDSMTALNDVITASKGTGADFGDTARALAGIVNAYGREVISTTEAGDIFVKTIQDGVTTGQELASSLGNITGIAAAAGVSFNEIGAAIATLTQSGIGTSEAITGLKGTISSILKPSKEAEKVFQELGIAYGGAALKSKGLSGILKEISEKTGGNIDSIGKLIPPVEALNTVLSLTKDSASKFTEELGKMSPATGAASESASKVAEQYADAVNQLSIAFDLLKINIGESLSEALTPFIVELTKLLQIFNSLDRSFIDSIVNIVKWTAIISGAVLAITGLIVKLTALPFKIIGIGKLFSNLVDGIDQLKARFSGLAQFLDYGGKFSIAVNAAKTMIEILKKAIDAIKGSFDWLSTVTNLKINQIAVEQEQKNAQKLIVEYNKLRAAKKDISAEDLKMYSRAFAVAQIQSKSKLGKEFLQKEGIAASQLADFKNYYNERLKLANKNSNEEDKINTNTVNITNKNLKKSKEHQEDYKNDVNRIMDGLAQDETKRTLDDLNYKVWAENKKYAEERKILDKAVKLKQATTAQLKALEKEHQIAITNLYMDAQAEQDKIDKENKTKEKVKQKELETEIAKIREGFTDDEKKRTLSETDFKLYELSKQKAAEKKRIDELITLKVATNKDLEALDIEYKTKEDKIRKEALEAEKQKEQKLLDLKNQINTQKEQIEGNYFSTVIGFIGKFNSGMAQGIQTFQSYFNNIKAINTQRDNTIAKIEKEIDVSTKAGKENADQLSKAAITNAAMAQTVDTIALVGTIALDWLINSINNYEKLTAEANKYNQTLNDANDWILLITKSLPFVGELLAAMGKSIGKAFGAEYLEDKLKIQPLLDEISTAERKKVLSDTDFKIEMVNKEYAEKERALKKAIEDNVASENDLIRLEKLRQAAITKIILDNIQEQKDIKKSISDLNDKENEKFLDDTEKRIIETNREYDEKIKKLKEYIKEGKATNDDLIELEKIRNKSIENIFKEKIIDTEKAAIQKIYDFEQEAIKKTAKKKKEAAEETIKTYDKELEKAKSTIEKIDEELKKRTKERQQSQESANLFQLKRAQIKSTLPADFERMPIDVFEIESASQEEQLKQSFALGQISLDQLNKDLMDLAVKKNLFYERIANSLVVGTKEHLDFQKKANDAYSEFASLNEKTTEEQLNQQKKLAEQEQTKYDNLKKQQLKNIDDIEAAQTNSLIRLENKWKTPAGSFKLSMDEALASVADKMDAELSNFIDRAKQAISDFKSQKIYDQTSQPPIQEAKTTTKIGAYMEAVTSMVNMTMSDLINKTIKQQTYEQKVIAENEARAQAAAASFANKKSLSTFADSRFNSFATGGIFDSNKGFGAAMLHDNEMILNPFQQKNLFDKLAAGGGGINVTINTGAVNSMADINKIASAVSQVIRTDYLRR